MYDKALLEINRKMSEGITSLFAERTCPECGGHVIVHAELQATGKVTATYETCGHGTYLDEVAQEIGKSLYSHVPKVNVDMCVVRRRVKKKQPGESDT